MGRRTPERLGRQRNTVADGATTLLLSAASSWEIAIKHQLGQLPLPETPAHYLPATMQRLGVTGLAVEHAHALHVAELPRRHRDPFDRLLVARAMHLEVPIVSGDT